MPLASLTRRIPAIVQRTLPLLALLLSFASTARAECELSGVGSIDRVRVRIAGEPLRTFSVWELPLAVRPGNGNAYRDVRVLGPLHFTARSDAPAPWTLARAGLVADGMLWLTPEVEVEELRERMDSEELMVRVQVDAGVWISRLNLPCAVLALGHAEGRGSAPDWGLRGGPRWSMRGQDLWLMSQPGEGASVRVDAPAGLTFVELEHRAGWMRVAARFGSGAAIRGWVRQHHLEIVEERNARPTTFERTVRETPASQCTPPRPRRDEYLGPAHIALGAEVRLRPDGPIWAHVSERAAFTIRWRRGSAWVRIVHVPGLRGDGDCPAALDHAWVPRTSVRLEGEPNAPPQPATPGDFGRFAQVDGRLRWFSAVSGRFAAFVGGGSAFSVVQRRFRELGRVSSRLATVSSRILAFSAGWRPFRADSERFGEVGGRFGVLSVVTAPPASSPRVQPPFA